MLSLLPKRLRRRFATVIEEARETDSQHLASIHQDAFLHGWSDGEFSRMLANEAYLCLVARRMGAAEKPPCAFILVRVADDEAEVITIAVDASSRRKGIAAMLLSEAIRRLQRDRVRVLFLEVDERNDAAVGLYRQHAFRQVGERKGYYPASVADSGTGTTALVMQRDLG